MLCPRSVLVTGANRGIGLELVRQLTRLEPTPPKHVFAACRNPDTATDLTKLAEDNAAISVVKIDVEEENDIVQAKRVVEEHLDGAGLNLLINNAGLAIRNGIEQINADDMLKCYRINTVGPLLMTKHFLPLLRKSALSAEGPMSCSRSAVINISTGVASIGQNDTGGKYDYRCSKAALNMGTKNMSVDLLSDGILVAAVHPGWVKTEMGGERALIEAEESVRNMFSLLAGLAGQDSTGTFHHQNGNIIPW